MARQSEQKKKPITRLVHNSVRVLHLEGFIHALGYPRLRGLLKLLPRNTDYSPTASRTVRRDGVLYKTKLSDYTQWSVFVSHEDEPWRFGIEHLDKKGLIIDVGANFGAFSLKVAHRLPTTETQRVWAFEPNPFIRKDLEENLVRNPGLEQRINIFPYALGDNEGPIQMAFSQENSGDSHVLRKGEQGQLTAQMKTLDQLLEEKGSPPVAFMKVDVEGFEPGVLAGALQTIVAYRPAIFIELTDAWYRSQGTSVTRLLDQYIWPYYSKVKAEQNPGEWVSVDRESIRSIIEKERQFNLYAQA